MKDANAPADELIRRSGAAIASRRKAAGFTQARVADAMGFEKETVSRIENGVIALTIHRLGQFAELFYCRLSTLLGDYRGGVGEGAWATAAQISDLPRDDRRSILRIVEDTAAMARGRKRAELEAAISAAPHRPRARPKL